ncbi:acyltransferase family protein [Paenibacillus lautus]|uniref:Acyltransferase 3 domain-containing protein n=1 Tax=Paenibacillus lautus TaxID=1401 RepID=A0A1R1B421_PAELA|nr:hypothetical protein BK123_11650 [Paenibacillus lautus]
MIKEVIFLRSIACLAIVLGHSIASSLSWYPHITSEAGYITDSWKMLMQLLLFGTPIFVFISALVLSYSYPNGTPKHFLSKRLIFILIPYVIMGLGYAILASLTQGSFNNLLGNMFDNVILGQFHGYFIIIIFQFYLLHIVFHKLVNYIRIERLVIYSLIINVIYLQIAGVYLQDTRWGTQLWWFPLCAWIFYYSLAYYLGRNLDKFRSALNRHRWAIGISVF